MKKKKKRSGAFTTVLLVVILLVGLSLLLYPTLSNYYNSFHQTRAIASYVQQIDNLDDEQYEAIWQKAVAYNARLTDHPNNFILTEEQLAEYESLLDVTGTGIMGYVEIPSIDVSLPIYHGTSEGVLQIAAGHIDWTSLPVGGIGSHCALSGHRGLPSAKLFTDLDKLSEGDVFLLRVLDEVLTYQVDQILIVLPSEMDDLLIDEAKDYCTLTTCTPYGINTHRLLVRGHRIESTEEAASIRITADAVQIEELIVAPIVAVPLLLLLLLILLLLPRRRKKNPTLRNDGGIIHEK